MAKGKNPKEDPDYDPSPDESAADYIRRRRAVVTGEMAFERVKDIASMDVARSSMEEDRAEYAQRRAAAAEAVASPAPRIAKPPVDLRRQDAILGRLDETDITEMQVGTPEASVGTWAPIADKPEAPELPPPRGYLKGMPPGGDRPEPRGPFPGISLPFSPLAVHVDSTPEPRPLVAVPRYTAGGGPVRRGYPFVEDDAPNALRTGPVDPTDPRVVKARAEDEALRARPTQRGTATRGAVGLKLQSLKEQGINLPNLEVSSGLTTAQMLGHYRTDPKTGAPVKVEFEDVPSEERLNKGARGELTAYPPPGAVPVTRFRRIPVSSEPEPLPAMGKARREAIAQRQSEDDVIEYRDVTEVERRPIGTVSSGPRGAKSARFARRKRPEAQFAEAGSSQAQFLGRSQEGSPAEMGSPVIDEPFMEFVKSGETPRERTLAGMRENKARRTQGSRRVKITPEDMMKMYVARRQKEAYMTSFGTRGRPTYTEARDEYFDKATPEGVLASREAARRVDPSIKFSETPDETLKQLSSGEWRVMGGSVVLGAFAHEIVSAFLK